MAQSSRTSEKLVSTSTSLPMTSNEIRTTSPPSTSSETTSSTTLRAATSARSSASPRSLTPWTMWVTSLLMTSLAAAAAAVPSTATTLHFATQPSDRPLALYRAPAPYQQAGKRTLNSVIITSKPFSITEQQQQQQQRQQPMGTTSAPATEAAAAPASGSARAATSSSSSSAPAAAPSAPATHWRRIASSATTERPTVTLSLPRYSIDCAEGMSCSETIAVDTITPRPTFKPYPQDVLDKFLRDFAAASRVQNDRKPPEDSVSDRATNRLANLYLDNEDEPASSEPSQDTEAEAETDSVESGESQGKSRWHMLHQQQHHHPYDDRDGWVSLDPVPWSTSKVAKWHATHTKRPEYKPPNRWDARPPLQWDKPSRPQWPPRPTYDDEYDAPQRPPHWESRPPHGDRWPSDALGGKPPYAYEPPQRPPHWSSGHDIITDNRPNRWPDAQPSTSYHPWEEQRPSHARPHYDYSHAHAHAQHERPSSGGYHEPHRHPPSHPDESEGQWVLVSSTKGYATPHRHKLFQRALAITARPISTKRSVRLTVLPALNGTANTTISHGGLLEVESTFQSVEEEQQQQQQDQLRPQHVQYDIPAVQAVVPKNTRNLRLVAQQASQDNSRALLAAVGAGMVPATIALMAPLVLGRRRRRSTLRLQNQATSRLLKEAFRRSPMHQFSQ